MRRIFECYSDPGHGWVKVDKSIILSLGIEDRISTCSYYRNGAVFLEEDSDLAIFYHAFRNKHGVDPVFREKHTDKSSRVRNYKRYTAALLEEIENA